MHHCFQTLVRGLPEHSEVLNVRTSAGNFLEMGLLDQSKGRLVPICVPSDGAQRMGIKFCLCQSDAVCNGTSCFVLIELYWLFLLGKC